MKSQRIRKSRKKDLKLSNIKIKIWRTVSNSATMKLINKVLIFRK
jgi:hypothetical protein